MRIDIDDADTDVGGVKLYEDTPYTGEIVETDGLGNLIWLGTYTGGYEDGLFREWFSDGRPKSEGEVKRGVGRVGSWRTWHPNGQLASEDVFGIDGKLQVQRRWSEDGEQTEPRPRA
ncbi:toxin-antitoxin system YwqK family antitoxin [Nocardia sp. NPDC088792]|uniref:toxin-antitoxin system YwqK family antitoxin n=1 Tax=Nocardia sp. NPDC088792 TaxID=3364332 RepID=UPI003808A4D9